MILLKATNDTLVMELEEGGHVITKVIGIHHLETMNVCTMSGICAIMFQSINEMLRHFPERVKILKLQMVLDVTSEYKPSH